MAVDTSAIGKPTTRARVVVERGPVTNFAKACTDTNAIYADESAAKAAGLDNIPAPPIFSFAMGYWGTYPEQQKDLEKVEGNAMFQIMGSLMSKGGMVLHGEQEFEYHRPIVVGDVLRSEGKIVDVYEKESKGKTMTFIVMETVWSDDKSGDPVVTEKFNLIHRA